MRYNLLPQRTSFREFFDDSLDIIYWLNGSSYRGKWMDWVRASTGKEGTGSGWAMKGVSWRVSVAQVGTEDGKDGEDRQGKMRCVAR